MDPTECQTPLPYDSDIGSSIVQLPHPSCPNNGAASAIAASHLNIGAISTIASSAPPSVSSSPRRSAPTGVQTAEVHTSPSSFLTFNDDLDLLCDVTGDGVPLVAATVEQCDELRKTVSQCEAQLEHLRTDHEQCASKLEEAQKLSHERKAVIATMMKNEEWYKSNKASLESEIETLTARYNELYKNATQKLSDATKELDGHEKIVKSLRAQLHSVEIELQTTLCQLEKAKEQFQASEQIVRQHSVELEEAKRQFEAAQLKASQVADLLKVNAELQRNSQAKEMELREEIRRLTRVNERQPLFPQLSNITNINDAAMTAKVAQWKQRLQRVLQLGGGKMGCGMEQQSIEACIESVGALLQQKTQEAAELLGYCQQLLDNGPSAPKA